MKTLVINRPTGLDRFQKLIPSVKEVERMPRDEARLKLNTWLKWRDSFTRDQNLAHLQYRLFGVQVVCDDGLSRDLEVSRVTGSLEDLVWPADVMLVSFRDKELPSCLVARRHITSGIGQSSPASPGMVVCIGNKDGAINGAMIGQAEWASYVATGDLPQMPPSGGDVLQDREEYECVRYMTALCAKVLAYASVPQNVPVKLSTRAEKKAAGIHPSLHNEKPTLLFRHLPRVVRTEEAEAGHGASDGKAHDFYGRAGHIRVYRDERYVNMRGKWQWIPPVPPPEGIKVVYRVRKVGP